TVNTSFYGNNLNILTGKISLSQTRLIDPRNDYSVDTLQLAATGLGKARSISLKSDMADGYIQGNFDVPTLPAYLKTIAKKYIPSLIVNNVPPKPQNFACNLTLKSL